MSLELPYVTMVLRGLKPSKESKGFIISINDPDIGNFRVEFFITAGNVPDQIIHTKFGPEAQGVLFNPQKATIHKQNTQSVQAKPIIPTKLSDGMNPQGTCAKFFKVFEVSGSGRRDFTECKDDGMVPKVVVQESVTQVSTIPSGIQQTLMGTQQTFQQTFQQGQQVDPFQQLISGKRQTVSTSERRPGQTGGLTQLAKPPGTKEVRVPHLMNTKRIMIGFQVPGGPRPFAVDTGQKVFPYWFITQTGQMLKARIPYVGANTPSSEYSMKFGAKQAINAQKALYVANLLAGLPPTQLPTDVYGNIIYPPLPPELASQSQVQQTTGQQLTLLPQQTQQTALQQLLTGQQTGQQLTLLPQQTQQTALQQLLTGQQTGQQLILPPPQQTQLSLADLLSQSQTKVDIPVTPGILMGQQTGQQGLTFPPQQIQQTEDPFSQLLETTGFSGDIPMSYTPESEEESGGDTFGFGG